MWLESAAQNLNQLLQAISDRHIKIIFKLQINFIKNNSASNLKNGFCKGKKFYRRTFNMRKECYWCQGVHRNNFIIIFWFFGKHHEERSRSLAMGNKVQFRLSSFVKNEINACGQVVQSHFMPCEIPKFSSPPRK